MEVLPSKFSSWSRDWKLWICQLFFFFFAAIEFQGKHLWCFNATPLSVSTERASSERERFLCRCVSCERRSLHLKGLDWSKPVVKSSIISSLKDSVWTPPADRLFAPERHRVSRGSLIGSPPRERAMTCSKTAPMLRPVIEIPPETRHEDTLSFCSKKLKKTGRASIRNRLQRNPLKRAAESHRVIIVPPRRYLLRLWCVPVFRPPQRWHVG